MFAISEEVSSEGCFGTESSILACNLILVVALIFSY